MRVGIGTNTRLAIVCMGLGMSLAVMSPAHAQGGDDDGPKGPSLHDLAKSTTLRKAHADFSRYRYCPPGDKIIEQPDAARLLFRTPDGQPDGYAERRGSAIVYYDRAGKAIRVQPFDEEVPEGQ